VIVRSVLPFETSGAARPHDQANQSEPVGTEEPASGCGGWMLNHRPLGYEDTNSKPSFTFQELDAAGNDRKHLETYESILIGP
jgi:hypothetical protein